MSAPATTAPPFQALIDEHSEPVLAFLRSSVGPDDADDCLQETFLSALRAYPPADPGNLRGWLFKIARNKAIDRHRARRRAPSAVGGADELDLTAPDPAPAWLGGRGAKGMRSRDTAVWNAVAELPEGQRAAVCSASPSTFATARSATRSTARRPPLAAACTTAFATFARPSRHT